MGSAEDSRFRDIGEALTELQDHLVALDGLVKRKVLPNQRGGLVQRLRAVHTLSEQMRELLDRSGMLHRLGFVQEGQTVQPVMRQAPEPVNQPDEIATEGSGVP